MKRLHVGVADPFARTNSVGFKGGLAKVRQTTQPSSQLASKGFISKTIKELVNEFGSNAEITAAERMIRIKFVDSGDSDIVRLHEYIDTALEGVKHKIIYRSARSVAIYFR